MPSVADLLSRTDQLALAVRVHAPYRLANTFAMYAGQFYNRRAFDLLARETHALYAASDRNAAASFQSALDARLERRSHAPVDWNADAAGERRP